MLDPQRLYLILSRLLAAKARPWCGGDFLGPSQRPCCNGFMKGQRRNHRTDTVSRFLVWNTGL